MLRSSSVFAFVLLLGGCARWPNAPLQEVVGVYGTPAEAASIGCGGFGAVPIAFVGEQDAVRTGGGGGVAVRVRLKSGQYGWVPGRGACR